jgi:hypothetical protein
MTAFRPLLKFNWDTTAPGLCYRFAVGQQGKGRIENRRDNHGHGPADDHRPAQLRSKDVALGGRHCLPYRAAWNENEEIDEAPTDQQKQDGNACERQSAFWDLLHDGVEVALRDALVTRSCLSSHA